MTFGILGLGFRVICLDLGLRLRLSFFFLAVRVCGLGFEV